MNKVFVKVFVFSLVLALMVSFPASAATHLWTRHISAAHIKNGEANYDNAGFERFKIFVVDDENTAEQAHVDATGKLTLSGGSYTYGDEAVNNTSKTFDLKANMEVGDTLSYKTDNDFIKDAADTGLNGVTATWTFDSMSGLNGSGDIPNFTSTKSQLTTAVPHIKLKYNNSNQITAIAWSIVKASDTQTPIAVDYNSRVRIDLVDKNDKKTTLQSKIDFPAGMKISGDTQLENVLSEDNIQYIEFSFRNRSTPGNPFAHEWRFYTSAPAATRLWTRHISAATIKNGEANYDNAEFERFKIFVVNDDTAEQAHVDETGKLTLSGGKYTYNGEAVNNTSKTFDLKSNMEVGKTLDYKIDSDFRGEADTGLNGVTATWTFDSMSGLNGSGDIPTFTPTKSQLTTAVPYIKLFYNTANQITSIAWSIVKVSDTQTPITVDYNSRVRIEFADKNDNSTTLLPKTDFNAGTTLSGTINLEEPLTESSIQYFQVSFRNRGNLPYAFAHEWRFYTDNPTPISSSGGGCDVGFMSVFALSLFGAVLLKKR